MSRDRELLRRAGEALYGERWQTALAQAIGVSDRTVRFWMSGQQQPRPGVWRDILDLAVSRRRGIDEMLPELRGRGGAEETETETDAI